MTSRASRGPGLRAGPLPSPTLDDAVTHLSKARAGILDLLSGQDRPVTVGQLARATGQHHNTVREHLDALVEAGLATSRTAKANGRGRPAMLYAAEPIERLRPQLAEITGLAGAMAAHIARTSPDPRAEARELGRHWGAELLAADPALLAADPADQAAPVRPTTPADPADRAGPATAAPPVGATRVADEVAALLTRLRYDPVMRSGHLVMQRCPVLAVARRFPDVVCQIHLGVVEGWYDARDATVEGLAIEPFAERAGCRLYLPDAVAHPREPPPGQSPADAAQPEGAPADVPPRPVA